MGTIYMDIIYIYMSCYLWIFMDLYSFYQILITTNKKVMDVVRQKSREKSSTLTSRIEI